MNQKYAIFVICFGLFGLGQVVSASSYYVVSSSKFTFAVETGIKNDTLVTDTLRENIRHHVSDLVNQRCGQACSVMPQNISLVSMSSSADYVFSVVLHVFTLDAAASLVIATPGLFFPGSIYKSWQQEVVTNTAEATVTITEQGISLVEGASSRPASCGDGVATASVGEECDDFNLVDGDGCSSTCKLEAGWMCAGGYRPPDARNAAGSKFTSSVVNGTTVYAVSSEPESCPVTDLCVQGELWQPELWTDKYGNDFDVTTLPPRGFYCVSTCGAFPKPEGMLIQTVASDTGDTCSLVDLDECKFGLAVCDFMAYCENKPYDAATGGYACFCSEGYFPTAELGAACTDSGFEVVLLIAGKENYNAADDPNPDIAVMNTVRESFMDTLLPMGVFKSKMNKQILLDSVHDYPPQLVRVLSDEGYEGRALYEVKVRISSAMVNVMEFVSSTIFTDLSSLEAVLTDSSTPSTHKLFQRDRCSNEQGRVCSTSSDCLNGGTCAKFPAVTVTSLDAGGTSAPFYTTSTGAEVVSVSYDNSQTGWHIRVRYSPSPNAVTVLYLPRLDSPPTLDQLAGFVPDEFPCLPFGVGKMQQRRDNTVCCLDKVNRHFTTVEGFGEYMSNNNSALLQAIHDQNACLQRGSPPSNATSELLNGTQDFVVGKFQNMLRSTSTLDSTQTVGYQDVLVFYAYEDALLSGAITKPITGGVSLRFFVGMASMTLTDTTFLSTSVSSREVSSDITSSYVFSTSGTTSFTFIKDVSVDLIEVANQTTGETLKFARILVGVPADVTEDDVHGLIPLTSIVAKVGYTKDTAPAIQTFYPCINMYSGTPKAEIDFLLEAQAWCAFQDKLCEPLGPAPVNMGGQVSFIVPLAGDSWSKSGPQGILTKKLFLDFILAVKDKSGKRVMTNVETKTELTPTSISTMCTEQRLESSIDSMFSIDIHLGLTNSSSLINTSLESAYDVTRSSEPVHLTRDVSTTASNILTWVIKGKEEVFSRQYSRDYSIEIEDMISVYFLSMDKKSQVDALVASGLAVREEIVPGSASEINLRPTEQLLSICPLSASRAALGCMTRYEIKSRALDRRTDSIVEIAPENEDTYAATMDTAGIWTQLTLGDSEFAHSAGRRHADAMNEEFDLNNRYRKAYMVSPVIPWRQSELRAEGFETTIGLSQYSISFVMLAFDQNIGTSFEPVAQVSIPGKLPIPVEQFQENLALQGALASAYAQGLGLPPNSVSIDPDSIRQEAVNETDSGSGRRRLLGVYYITLYECIVKFYETETDDQGESVAAKKASEIVDAITDVEAATADVVFEKVKQAVESACSSCPLPTLEDVKPPVELREAIKNTVRDVASCMNPKISVDLEDLGGGTATCDKRTIDGVEYEINVRGPLTQTEWDAVGGGYRVTQGMDGLKSGRASYDLCGSIPAHFLLANVDGIQSKWDALKAKFSACCLCKPNEPKIPQTKKDYVHRYSWSVPTQELTENIGWKRRYESATGVSLMNPQIDTFRSAPALSLKISKENLPPASWKFSRKTGLSYIPAHLCTEDIISNWFGVSGSCGGCKIKVQRHWVSGGGAHLKPITCNMVCANAGLTCKGAGGLHLCNIYHWKTCETRNDQVGTETLLCDCGYPSANVVFEGGVCGAGKGMLDAEGECLDCPLSSFRSGTDFERISCQTCHDATGDAHRTTTAVGSSTVDACVCNRGYFQGSTSTCEKCPANTFKSVASNDESLCLPCPEGLLSRAGSTEEDACSPPYSIGGYTAEANIYQPLLGLISHQTRVQDAWIDPRPHEQDNKKRCMFSDDGLTVDCPGESLTVFPRAVLPSSTDNEIRLTEFTSSDEIVGLSKFIGQGVDTRFRVAMNPSAGNQLIHDIFYDLEPLKDTPRYLSLPVRQSYGGPHFPGFYEQILSGSERFSPGAKLNYKLRLDAINIDLTQTEVSLVTFITNKRLESQTDFQWIVCADTTNGLSICQDSVPDPDDASKTMYRNAAVLDATVFRLSSTKSCYGDVFWLYNCEEEATESPLKNRFDDVFEWVPFGTTQPDLLPAATDFFLYTTFFVGQAAQCVDHGCIESDFYAQMPSHLSEALTSSSIAELRFLPGTEITIQTVPESLTYEDTYPTSAGLLAAEKYTHPIPLEGAMHVKYKSLDETTQDQLCQFDQAGTGVVCRNETMPNVFTKNMLTDGSLGKIEADFAAILPVKICCDQEVDATCETELAVCHDGVDPHTSTHSLKEDITIFEDLNVGTAPYLDLLNSCGVNKDETCSCSSNQEPVASSKDRQVYERGSGVFSCAPKSCKKAKKWRISNAGDITWTPIIGEIMVYQDKDCTIEYDLTDVTKSTSIPARSGYPFSYAFDGSVTTHFRPNWKPSAFAWKITFEFEHEVSVMCVKTTANTNDPHIPIGMGYSTHHNDAAFRWSHGILLEASCDGFNWVSAAGPDLSSNNVVADKAPEDDLFCTDERGLQLKPGGALNFEIFNAVPDVEISTQTNLAFVKFVQTHFGFPDTPCNTTRIQTEACKIAKESALPDYVFRLTADVYRTFTTQGNDFATKRSESYDVVMRLRQNSGETFLEEIFSDHTIAGKRFFDSTNDGCGVTDPCLGAASGLVVTGETVPYVFLYKTKSIQHATSCDCQTRDTLPVTLLNDAPAALLDAKDLSACLATNTCEEVCHAGVCSVLEFDATTPAPLSSVVLTALHDKDNLVVSYSDDGTTYEHYSTVSLPDTRTNQKDGAHVYSTSSAEKCDDIGSGCGYHTYADAQAFAENTLTVDWVASTTSQTCEQACVAAGGSCSENLLAQVDTKDEAIAAIGQSSLSSQVAGANYVAPTTYDYTVQNYHRYNGLSPNEFSGWQYPQFVEQDLMIAWDYDTRGLILVDMALLGEPGYKTDVPGTYFDSTEITGSCVNEDRSVFYYFGYGRLFKVTKPAEGWRAGTPTWADVSGVEIDSLTVTGCHVSNLEPNILFVSSGNYYIYKYDITTKTREFLDVRTEGQTNAFVMTKDEKIVYFWKWKSSDYMELWGYDVDASASYRLAYTKILRTDNEVQHAPFLNEDETKLYLFASHNMFVLDISGWRDNPQTPINSYGEGLGSPVAGKTTPCTSFSPAANWNSDLQKYEVDPVIGTDACFPSYTKGGVRSLDGLYYWVFAGALNNAVLVSINIEHPPPPVVGTNVVPACVDGKGLISFDSSTTVFTFNNCTQSAEEAGYWRASSLSGSNQPVSNAGRQCHLSESTEKICPCKITQAYDDTLVAKRLASSEEIQTRLASQPASDFAATRNTWAPVHEKDFVCVSLHGCEAADGETYKPGTLATKAYKPNTPPAGAHKKYRFVPGDTLSSDAKVFTVELFFDSFCLNAIDLSTGVEMNSLSISGDTSTVTPQSMLVDINQPIAIPDGASFQIEVTFSDAVVLGCSRVVGLGVQNDVSNVNRHRGGVRVEYWDDDAATYKLYAAAVPFSDETPLAAPGYTGNVQRYPLTGLYNTNSQLFSVDLPKHRYWKLALEENTDAPVFEANLCSTPGCTSEFNKKDAGLCPADPKTCYSTQPENFSCDSTMKQELQTLAMVDGLNLKFVEPGNEGCAVGSYYDQSTANCTLCALEETTPFEGATKAEQCQCRQGFFGSDSSVCTACGGGMTTEIVGAQSEAACGCLKGSYFQKAFKYESLTAWYKFEKDAQDYGPNGVHLQPRLDATPSFDPDGYIIANDDISYLVPTPQTVIPTGTTTLTVSFWVKNWVDGYIMHWVPTEQIEESVENSVLKHLLETDTKWSFMVAVFDTTGTTLYKDGVKIANSSTAKIPAEGFEQESGQDVGIFCNPDSASSAHDFQGEFKDLRFYTAAFTAEEVGQLYQDSPRCVSCGTGLTTAGFGATSVDECNVCLQGSYMGIKPPEVIEEGFTVANADKDLAVGYTRHVAAQGKPYSGEFGYDADGIGKNAAFTELRTIAWIPDTKKVIIGDSSTSKIKYMDLESYEVTTLTSTSTSTQGTLQTLCAASDKKIFVAGTKGLWEYDVESGVLSEIHSGYTVGCSVSKDGWIAFSDRYVVYEVELANYANQRSFNPNADSYIQWITHSPDDEYVVYTDNWWRQVWKFHRSTSVKSLVAGKQNNLEDQSDGSISTAYFYNAAGLSFSRDGRYLYVLNWNGVKKIDYLGDSSSSSYVSTLSGPTSGGGRNTGNSFTGLPGDATFNILTDIVVLGNGYALVLDSGLKSIYQINLGDDFVVPPTLRYFTEQVCLACSTGITTASAGATSADQCNICQKGYVTDGESCSACPSLQTTEYAGAQTCGCASGSYLGPADNCTACGEGMTSYFGATSHLQCYTPRTVCSATQASVHPAVSSSDMGDVADAKAKYVVLTGPDAEYKVLFPESPPTTVDVLVISGSSYKYATELSVTGLYTVSAKKDASSFLQAGGVSVSSVGEGSTAITKAVVKDLFPTYITDFTGFAPGRFVGAVLAFNPKVGEDTFGASSSPPYLNLGSRTFNIAETGGLTVVWKGLYNPGSGGYQAMFGFGAGGAGGSKTNTLRCGFLGQHDRHVCQLWDSSQVECRVESNVLGQGSGKTKNVDFSFIVQYNWQTKVLSMNVDATAFTTTCTHSVPEILTTPNTLIGHSQSYGGACQMYGKVHGLYAFGRLISNENAQEVLDAIVIGDTDNVQDMVVPQVILRYNTQACAKDDRAPSMHSTHAELLPAPHNASFITYDLGSVKNIESVNILLRGRGEKHGVQRQVSSWNTLKVKYSAVSDDFDQAYVCATYDPELDDTVFHSAETNLLKKSCLVKAQYIFVSVQSGELSYDEIQIIPSKYQFGPAAKYTWSQNAANTNFITLWSNLSGTTSWIEGEGERKDPFFYSLDEHFSYEYFDGQNEFFSWPEGYLIGGLTWKQHLAAGDRKPMFPSTAAALQPLVATFPSKKAYFQIELPFANVISEILVQPGPRYPEWKAVWGYAWPGHVKVFTSFADDFDVGADSTAVLAHEGDIDYGTRDARGIPRDDTFEVVFANGPKRGRFVRMVFERCTESLCVDNPAEEIQFHEILQFRAGLKPCVYKCEGCCHAGALIGADSLPSLNLESLSQGQTTTANLYLASAQDCQHTTVDNQATMRPCPEGRECKTDAYTLDYADGRYQLSGTSNKTPTLQVRKGKPSAITFPSGHPLVISENSEWGAAALSQDVVTAGSVATVTVPAGSTKTVLYYYCSLHLGMGVGKIEILESDGARGTTACAIEAEQDFTAVQAEFSIGPIDTSTVFTRNFDASLPWMRVTDSMPDYDVNNGHLLQTNPSLNKMSSAYVDEASAVDTGIFLFIDTTRPQVKSGLETLTRGNLHTADQKVKTISLATKAGYIGPGGGTGTVQKIRVDDGWDRVSVELEPHLALKSVWRDNDSNMYPEWTDSRNVHVASFITDKELVSDEDWKWIVCGDKSEQIRNFPTPSFMLDNTQQVGESPPGSVKEDSKTTFKTDDIFESQGGWLKNIPSFSDVNCDPSQVASIDCRSSYSSTIAALGYGKCDLTSDLSVQENCVYTVRDIIERNFLNAFNRMKQEDGVEVDKLTLPASSLTRGLIERTPVIATHLDTAPVLLNKGKATVCHTDLFGAQVDTGSGSTARFLPRRDYSIASNPPTGYDQKGALANVGFDSMPCSIDTGLADSAAEEAFLGEKSLQEVLDLFNDKQDCVCGMIATGYVVDGILTTTGTIDGTFLSPMAQFSFETRDLTDISGNGVNAVDEFANIQESDFGEDESHGTYLNIDHARGLSMKIPLTFADDKTSGFSVSFWFYRSRESAYDSNLISAEKNDSPTTDNWAIILSTRKKMQLSGRFNDNAYSSYDTYNADGEQILGTSWVWHHLSIVQTDGAWHFYHDGVFWTSQAVGAHTFQGDWTFTFDTVNNANSFYLTDVRFFDYALTQANVDDIVAGPKPLVFPPPVNAESRKQTFRVERTDVTEGNGHENVYVTLLTKTDTQNGHVLGRQYLHPDVSVRMYETDPATNTYGATTKGLPGDYKICQDESDPDSDTGAVDKKNVHVLDGRVISLGKTPRPTYQPGVDGLVEGSYQSSVRWPDDGCSYMKPHLFVHSTIDDDFTWSQFLKSEAVFAPMGVINDLDNSGVFQWMYDENDLDAQKNPSFDNVCEKDVLNHNLPKTVPCKWTPAYGEVHQKMTCEEKNTWSNLALTCPNEPTTFNGKNFGHKGRCSVLTTLSSYSTNCNEYCAMQGRQCSYGWKSSWNTCVAINSNTQGCTATWSTDSSKRQGCDCSGGDLPLATDTDVAEIEFDSSVKSGSAFIDKLYVPEKGWHYFLFFQHKDVSDKYYILPMPGNPGPAHVFTPGDMLIGGRGGVGVSAERCPISGDYYNEKGVLSWKPSIDAPGTEFFLYHMFLFGESHACRQHACQDAKVYDDSAELSKIRNAKIDPGSNPPLLIMQGSRFALSSLPKVPFEMQDNCLQIALAAPSFTDGQIVTKYYITKANALFAQDFGSFDECLGCSGGVCGLGKLPCKYFDTSTQKTYFTAKVYTAASETSELFTFWLANVADATSSDGITLEGFAVSAPGVPELSMATASWQTGDKLFTTENKACADGSSRRRALLSSLRQVRRKRPISSRKTIVNLARRMNAFRRLKLKEMRAKDTMKLKVESMVLPQRSMRKLLTIGAGGSEMDKTTSNTNMQREVTSLDGNRVMADSVCGSLPGVCELMRVSLDIPDKLYCSPESDIIEHVDNELSSLQAVTAGGFHFKTVSVYRAALLTKCFQSTVYSRRLLGVLTSHTVATAYVSLHNALSTQSQQECSGDQHCVLSLNLEDTEIGKKGFSAVHIVTDQNGEQGVRVCFGGPECHHRMEIANHTQLSMLPVEVKSDAPSSWAIIAVVLAVVLFIALCFAAKRWYDGIPKYKEVSTVATNDYNEMGQPAYQQPLYPMYPDSYDQPPSTTPYSYLYVG